MKKILFVFICLVSVVGLFAQESPRQPIQKAKNNARAKQRIEAQRIGFITQRLNLMPEESQQFWPIYNQYTEKIQQIRKGPKLKQTIDEMNDVDTEKFLTEQMDHQIKELELRKEYLQKLKTVISVQRIAKLYKAERDFRAELSRQLQEMKQKKK